MNGFLFWNDVLQRISNATDGAPAVIAGGCIRDYMLGLPPKDIDVFVEGEVNHLMGNNPEGFELDRLMPAREEYRGNLNNILFIQDYKYRDTAINIINIDAMVYGVLDNFDSNINKGMYDGMNLEISADMGKDLENREVTIVRQGHNSMQRAQRLVQKVHAAGERDWRITLAETEWNRQFEINEVALRNMFAVPI